MTSPVFHLSRPLSVRGRKPQGFLSVWCRSLGCPKNRVDTETLLGSLGAGIAECRDIRRADLVFINTCGFIEPAVKESVDAILEAVRDTEGLKRRPLVAVGGCVVGRYGIKDLQQEIPEVDLWLATKDLPRWPDMIRERLGLGACAPSGRLLSGCPSYAWLKVAEGCRHRCAFCTIPAIRGGLRSRPVEDIAAEARSLLAAGVKELDLVAQDLTDYGQDLQPGQEGLPALVRELAGLDGLFWLRMLYLYPKGITKDLLQTVKDAGPVLPYFDIPLQHSHPEVLKRMGRPFDADPERVCGMIREALPEAALRTTCIVGYPGETEAQFEHLCRFVEKTR
ncbi:MAG: MiaB/RimO family radical SAM methylthiotransferase, partial [Desulfovibrio sp.]|nr:MiaB/RimO family radical SAM methylthiotransferase [Desulfovibrio sp.]